MRCKKLPRNCGSGDQYKPGVPLGCLVEDVLDLDFGCYCGRGVDRRWEQSVTKRSSGLLIGNHGIEYAPMPVLSALKQFP